MHNNGSWIARLVPPILIEGLARIAGWLVGIWRPGWAYPAERAVRGRYWAWRLGAPGLKVGRNVQFEGEDRIRFGRGVRINDGCQVIAGTTGWVTLGDDGHMARMAMIAGSGGVDIGPRVIVSTHASIYSVQNRLDSETPGLGPGEMKPVKLGKDVFVGMGARIVPGITVGDRAIIAAGAVVVRDIPDRTTVAGVPARALGGGPRG